LYLYCEFVVPPKNKFLLLVCRSDPPLLFMINSKIPEFVQQKPDLLSCQVKLCSSDYNFLSHDSFINCSEIINRFSEEAIINQVLSDVGRIKGEINQTTRNEIIGVVKRARTISEYEKALIIRSLEKHGDL